MNPPRPPVQRPIFVVAAPLSGAPALLEALSHAPGSVALAQSESPFDEVPALAPANREEVFDDALLPGKRYPEVAEERTPTTAQSYVLPPRTQ